MSLYLASFFVFIWFWRFILWLIWFHEVDNDIYSFVIVIIECACCRSYRHGSDHNILCTAIGKFTTNHCYGLADLSLFLWSIYFSALEILCPKYRLFTVFCIFFLLRCIFCTFYSHSISSVFMVLHCSCLLSIMLLFWDYHSMLKRLIDL